METSIWDKKYGRFIPFRAKNMESIEKNIILVRDMLAFCHSKGLTPVFVLLPVTISLKHHFPEKYINEYVIGSMKRSMVDNELILDYFHDARYEDESLYINSFFFNAIGRKAFTEKNIGRFKQNNIMKALQMMRGICIYWL